ncbi:fused DSP-PTPase phosphatase/NAD kinase-like protein [Candidatus Spongiihabitans sp.]|uniref:fused DSP-PTPase phosphatase/NAD kinase-like protein n=1 Tax=Candidatus Spongiihabitans sp. TaxID=3101308 RepID=UPI003C6F6F02
MNPCPLTSTPRPQYQIQQFVDVCDNSDRYPIPVHCMQGVLRTGMMIAVYRKRYHNEDNETIFKTLPTFGRNFQRPRYNAFRKFVLNYSKADAALYHSQRKPEKG